MSARAIASQKMKRAGGHDFSNKSTKQEPTNLESLKQNSNEIVKQKLTIPQAIYLLEKKIIDLEDNLEKNRTTFKEELIESIKSSKTEEQHLSNHIDENKIKELIFNAVKPYDERIGKLEKEYSLLKLKLSQLETSIPSIRTSLQTIENKSTSYDKKLTDIEEIQKLVNKLSTHILTNE